MDVDNLKILVQWALGVGGIIAGVIAGVVGARRGRRDQDEEQRQITPDELAKALEAMQHSMNAHLEHELLKLSVANHDKWNASVASLAESARRDRHDIYNKIHAGDVDLMNKIDAFDNWIREYAKSVEGKFGDHDKRIRDVEIALARPRR